jgi:hypothetical protein
MTACNELFESENSLLDCLRGEESSHFKNLNGQERLKISERLPLTGAIDRILA